MLKLRWSAAEIHAWRYGRFHPPEPRVQVRREALNLCSQGGATGDIPRLCGMSKASFPRDLKAYVAGGSEQWQRLAPYRPQRELVQHRPTREGSCRQHPPATVAAAAATSAALTGMVRPPTPVRQLVQALGLKPRTVGMMPAKADGEAPEALQKTGGRHGEPKPKRASAPCFSWMPPIACVRPFGAWLGVSHGCVSKRPQAASG